MSLGLCVSGLTADIPQPKKFKARIDQRPGTLYDAKHSEVCFSFLRLPIYFRWTNSSMAGKPKSGSGKDGRRGSKTHRWTISRIESYTDNLKFGSVSFLWIPAGVWCKCYGDNKAFSRRQLSTETQRSQCPGRMLMVIARSSELRKQIMFFFRVFDSLSVLWSSKQSIYYNVFLATLTVNETHSFQAIVFSSQKVIIPQSDNVIVPSQRVSRDPNVAIESHGVVWLVKFTRTFCADITGEIGTALASI